MPFNSYLSPRSLAGLMVVVLPFLTTDNVILGDGPYLIYSILASIRPRMLYTVNECPASVEVTLRVGKVIDTVGLAGKQKGVTGFQTFTTPVLMGPREKAEIATDEYVPLSPILEGAVIVTKNDQLDQEQDVGEEN